MLCVGERDGPAVSNHGAEAPDGFGRNTGDVVSDHFRLRFIAGYIDPGFQSSCRLSSPRPGVGASLVKAGVVETAHRGSGKIVGEGKWLRWLAGESLRDVLRKLGARGEADDRITAIKEL